MSTITKNTETRVGSNRRVSPPSMNGRRPVHKTCTINLRLTEAEKNYLKAVAESQGITMSKLILDTMFGACRWSGFWLKHNLVKSNKTWYKSLVKTTNTRKVSCSTRGNTAYNVVFPLFHKKVLACISDCIYRDAKNNYYEVQNGQ